VCLQISERKRREKRGEEKERRRKSSRGRRKKRRVKEYEDRLESDPERKGSV
jgi:hypothetical protein